MDSRKKIASVMAGINLALGIASIAGAASAAADGPGDYIYDLNNHGIGGSRQNLLQLGQNVACKQSPESVAVDAIVKGSTLSPDDAKFLYDSAKTFLCP
jgi:hypothetical protein